MNNCNDCADNIPDKVNPLGGMCACGSFEAGLLKKPTEAQINDALVARGNRRGYWLFWPGNRDCKKFQAKKSPDIRQDLQGFLTTTGTL